MMRQQTDRVPYFLDKERRMRVLDALREVCVQRKWNLWAAHVRTNHVHVVVEADVRPEKVMKTFKAYASRGLNLLGIDGVGRKMWARHGSTRWLYPLRGFRDKVNRWRFTLEICCRAPLLYRRGSVGFAGSEILRSKMRKR